MRVIWRHVLIVLFAVVLLPVVAAAEGTPVVEPEPSASVSPPTATAAPPPPETPTAIATETPTAEPPGPTVPQPAPTSSPAAPTVQATSPSVAPSAVASPEPSAPASTPTPSAEARASEQTANLGVYLDVCFDPQRAGEVAFEVANIQIAPFSVGLQDTASTECRYAHAGDGPTAFTLTNTETGRTWTRTLDGDHHLLFADVPSGTYTLAATSRGRTATSAPFAFAAAEDGSIITIDFVVVRTFVAELDWEPGGTGDGPTEISISAYVCDDAARDVGGEFFRYGPSTESASAAMPARTATCRQAQTADYLSFVAQPLEPGVAPIRFWSEDGFVFYPLTWPQPENTIPAGDYIVTEGRSGVATASLHLSGWDNSFEFLFYGGPPMAVWGGMALSSADPAVANVLPADATWTLSQDGTVRYSGAVWWRELPLPDWASYAIPVFEGTYDLAVDAGPAFAPYRARVAILHNPQDPLGWQSVVSVVLQPVRPTPSPVPTTTAPTTTEPTSSPDPAATTAPSEPAAPAGTLTPAASPPAGSAVTGLPSTGQGGRNREATDASVLVSVAAVLALVAGLMWRRRTPAR